MAQKTIQGSETLARQIKLRRNELHLTIEEAASRAGVGTKTWSRYEAGESIRMDKCKGICKALNWNGLPNQDQENNEDISIQEYKEHKAWSSFLENVFGARAAMAFAAGSDILCDHIEEDMAELASLPAGSHIGQLNMSWLCDDLPQQFLMYYDYDFLYRMKCTLSKMRICAKSGRPMTAHSVMEELLLYLCNEEATALLELNSEIDGLGDNEESTYSEDWVFDLFDDMDIISCLYSDVYLDSDHSYHFSHWDDQQFYMGSNE
jgi:transcriptional regulator with XRE-family HTH domain